jgi:hypothetical protein
MSRSTATSRRSHAASGTVIPLGSLTQPGARSGARCLACGSNSVTRIAMSLTDGTPVEFTSCHRCEHRSWVQQGERLEFEHVLDKTRKPA